MNIVACIKRVPATETQPKVSSDGSQMEAAGVEYMLSFYDEIAVEQAVLAKEQLGGEVTVLTMGPSDATKEVRESLAKGADKGVLMKDDAWMERDCRSTAKALAAKLGELDAQLVFTGRVATDRDNAAVGPMLATYLGWACVTDVIELELTETGGVAKRASEDGIESYAFELPAVISCQKGLNEPRYAGLKGIMAAKKKPVEECEAAAFDAQAKVNSLALPPARSAGRIVADVPELIEALKNEAQVL